MSPFLALPETFFLRRMFCVVVPGVVMSSFFFFFFQAEDGIRDLIVTGVQTCALPICSQRTTSSPHPPSRPSVSRLRTCRAAPAAPARSSRRRRTRDPHPPGGPARSDRKSTRLNSSHDQISYAVFCLKKKQDTNTVSDC